MLISILKDAEGMEGGTIIMEFFQYKDHEIFASKYSHEFNAHI